MENFNLENIKRLLTTDFKDAILNGNFDNEKQFNNTLYEFLKLRLPYNISVEKEVRTKLGILDIVIDNKYILELKYADNIKTLNSGIAEIIRYQEISKNILIVILDVGKLQKTTIEKYIYYYKKVGSDTIVIKSSSKRKKNIPIKSFIGNNFAKRKFFITKDIFTLLNFNKNTIKTTLSRLEKKGWIERIEKGKYLIIPPGAQKGKYTLHEFVIGSMLVQPYIIAYWSALNFYGLTEQIPITVFIQTSARKKRQKMKVLGVEYQIVRIKEDKFFGIRKEWIEEKHINITDKEKTIIDCLDKPQYCGGIIEVAKGLKNGKFDKDKLVDYAKNIGNSGVIRRLGYICERFEIPINLPRIKTRNYLYLDPTMSHKGPKNAKWRLIINLDEKVLGILE